MRTVAVIGGGPAGMLAAIEAAKRGNKVLLIEKNEKLGKKLYITGKGRCNITNECDIESLISKIPRNPYFLYSSFYSLDTYMLMAYIEKLGVKLKIERGGRVFPASDKASDVIKALEKELKKNNVNILLNTCVKEIISKDDCISSVITDNKEYLVDSVVVATGGLSYPVTGSTGEGYKFAKKFGHSIESTRPSLVPLKTKENWVKDLAGLSLKNISIKLYKNKKIIYKDFGEMLFTHNGLSGPVILSASSHFEKDSKSNYMLTIDLKPSLDEKTLDNRLLRDFTEYINKDYKNSLDKLLPQKLIPIVVNISGISPEKKINSITKDERKKIINIIKNLTFNIVDTMGYNEAIITRGGIKTKEIDSSTMESKFVKGLYFAGEVIDVDGYTGGYNLQIAFSTGYLAGINC